MKMYLLSYLYPKPKIQEIFYGIESAIIWPSLSKCTQTHVQAARKHRNTSCSSMHRHEKAE